MELIEAFLATSPPLFNPNNVEPSPIGRTVPARISLHNRPIGEIVYEMTGRTREDLLDGLPRQLRLIAGEFDAYDIHLCRGRLQR
ncbi:MAG TPA: hypothetical protein VGY76_08585 [Solirubrobacteraceae bacterium]|nr:hypothetical protein [Solirubrobacteraceae bacterium]